MKRASYSTKQSLCSRASVYNIDQDFTAHFGGTGIPDTRHNDGRDIVAIIVIYPGVYKNADEDIYFLPAAANHCWRRAIKEETRLERCQ